MSVNIAIVWFRRDLRLEDNPALRAACAENDKIVPVYLHAADEEAPWQAGAASRWWLHHSLSALADSLHGKHCELVIRRQPSLRGLLALAQETGARRVYWNRLYEPAVIARDRHIKLALAENGIEPSSFNAALLKEPWEISKDDGTMYRVYTPFCKRYFTADDIDAPGAAPEKFNGLENPPDSCPVASLDLLPRIPWDAGFAGCWQPGESGAQAALHRFLAESLFAYAEQRDIPSQPGVSRLAPCLHFGELSPRQIWHAVKSAGAAHFDQGKTDTMQDVNAYLRQLIWRDFAHHILFHLPHTEQKPFNKKFEDFAWERNEQVLHAWKNGMTGIPLVDAGMRQLWHTGWMHNRIRMLAASMLTKNGLVHWLQGARWFWETLVDADLANNTMGWQWTAGCGVDAAPYFRVFSPMRQGQRFDPDGRFVRQWVPELSKLPDKYIHTPHLTPHSVCEQAGFKPGHTYPNPVLDLTAGRTEALKRYRALRIP